MNKENVITRFHVFFSNALQILYVKPVIKLFLSLFILGFSLLLYGEKNENGLKIFKKIF